MSIKTQIETAAANDFVPQAYDLAGVRIEFLSPPQGATNSIGLVRGTVPPGVFVPLHAHPEPELFYVLDGSIDFFTSRNGVAGWTALRTGDVANVPGGVQHAWRNNSSWRVILAVVTTGGLYAFFQDLATPLDSQAASTPPSPQVMRELLEGAARHNYWIASPEENAAIGLHL